MDIPEIEALCEKDFDFLVNQVQKEAFPIKIGARALPIVEPWFFTVRFSMTVYRSYLENACHRVRILGIEKIIIGNGKGRWMLEEHSWKKEGRFISFLCMFCEIAAGNGVEVILEPLGAQYSNYINRISEAVEVIQRVGMRNLFTMADIPEDWSKAYRDAVEVLGEIL